MSGYPKELTDMAMLLVRRAPQSMQSASTANVALRRAGFTEAEIGERIDEIFEYAQSIIRDHSQKAEVSRRIQKMQDKRAQTALFSDEAAPKHRRIRRSDLIRDAVASLSFEMVKRARSDAGPEASS